MTDPSPHPDRGNPEEHRPTKPIDWAPIGKALASRSAHRNVNNLLSIGWAVSILIIAVIIALVLR